MTTNTFAYNGFGARVSKSDSSGSNTYLRASSGLIGSIVSDSGATYTPGVSERRGTTSTYYHADIKNSVEQTSTSQTVAASKQYDAFGNEVSSSGSWQGPFQYGGAFGYHTDSDYGLKHLGARYYDSTTGRFLSRDPIKDGRNWYGYCFASPVGRTDPTGLLAPVVVYGAVILVGALIGGVGWDEEFDWWRVGASTALGALGGGMFLRPGNAATQAVTHYGTPGGGIRQGAWVQVGNPGVQTRAFSGKIRSGSPNTATVPGGSLAYPPGWEYWKGWIGQRKYMGPDIVPATRWGGGSLRH